MIISLNEANFEAETSKGTVLIDFYADWCAPCKRMMPKVREAAEHLKGKITVAKINMDESRELAEKFQISKERVRQIEARIKEKIAFFVESQGAASQFREQY